MSQLSDELLHANAAYAAAFGKKAATVGGTAS